MTCCRICGMLDAETFGECIICEDCAETRGDSICLNTQPEGCSCRDCQRYGNKECPYPGANPSMSMCTSFYMDVARHDAEIRKEERKRILGELEQTAQHNWEEIETDEGEMIRMVSLGELLAKIEDLRGAAP